MYLIIGSGRTASHISRYFELKKIPFLQWSRKSASLNELKILLTRVEKILLLITDSQIEGFHRIHLADFKGITIHMSGALELKGLVGFHPLMTFGPELYDLQLYERIHFATESKSLFHALLPELSNPCFEIKSGNRALYHAWAAYSGNLATLLWQEALPGLSALGAPPEALQLYLERVLANSFGNLGAALTGPIARKDHRTIDLHLRVLPEPARNLYLAFVKSSFPEYQNLHEPGVNL